jgi:hypothetical protein
MERRDVLKSASTLAAASTVGMAGCSGGGLLGGGGCDTPGDNLEDSLPDSSDYEQQGEATTGSGGENVESTISALFTGPDDEQLFFGITEFSDADTASSEANNVSSEDTGEGAFGYITADAYVYFAFGPDEDSVTSLMKASPTLGDGCVDNNLEFV